MFAQENIDKADSTEFPGTRFLKLQKVLTTSPSSRHCSVQPIFRGPSDHELDPVKERSRRWRRTDPLSLIERSFWLSFPGDSDWLERWLVIDEKQLDAAPPQMKIKWLENLQ